MDLLGHGGPQLVEGVASVFPLELDELLVVKYKTAICVLGFGRCSTRRDKMFSIFCPSVPDGTKCVRMTTFIRNTGFKRTLIFHQIFVQISAI